MTLMQCVPWRYPATCFVDLANTLPLSDTFGQLSRIPHFWTFEDSKYLNNHLQNSWRLWGWGFPSTCNRPSKLQLFMGNGGGPFVKPPLISPHFFSASPCFQKLWNLFQWIPHPRTTLPCDSYDFRTIFGRLPVSAYDFMLQILIYFHTSLNIPFAISLSFIVMTLRLFLIPL